MIITPSTQVVTVLAAAVKRASRLGSGLVGTENLLVVLADSIGRGRRLGVKSVRAEAMAAEVGNWAGDDGGVGEADPGVAALMRTAHDRALIEPAIPVSGALDECLGAAIAEAGDGVLTTTHLSVALLSLKSGRAADLFTLLRVDVGATIEAVRKAAWWPRRERCARPPVSPVMPAPCAASPSLSSSCSTITPKRGASRTPSSTPSSKR